MVMDAVHLGNVNMSQSGRSQLHCPGVVQPSPAPPQAKPSVPESPPFWGGLAPSHARLI